VAALHRFHCDFFGKLWKVLESLGKLRKTGLFVMFGWVTWPLQLLEGHFHNLFCTEPHRKLPRELQTSPKTASVCYHHCNGWSTIAAFKFNWSTKIKEQKLGQAEIEDYVYHICAPLDWFPVVAHTEEHSDSQQFSRSLSLFCSFSGLFLFMPKMCKSEMQLTRWPGLRVLPVALLLLEQYHNIILML
jgi:hypothetical protein